MARDYNFRPTQNVAGIASLLADKKLKEEQIRNAQQQRRNSNLSLLLQSVQLGSNLASAALERSAIKQDQDSRVAISDTMNNYFGVQQQLADTRPIQGPLTQQQAQVPGPMTQQGISPGREQLGQDARSALLARKQMLESQLEGQMIKYRPDMYAQSMFQDKFRAQPSETERAQSAANLMKTNAEIMNIQAKTDEILSNPDLTQEQKTQTKVVGDLFSTMMLAQAQGVAIDQTTMEFLANLANNVLGLNVEVVPGEKKFLGKKTPPRLRNKPRIIDK